MSNYTRIRTQLMDKECLLKALRNLGYIAQELRGGQELAIQGSPIHLILNPQTTAYDLITSRVASTRSRFPTSQSTPQEFLQNLNKEYATLKVVREVTRKGYHIEKRHIKKTGEVKLIAVKRVWT